jgi:hypothetical protein
VRHRLRGWSFVGGWEGYRHRWRRCADRGLRLARLLQIDLFLELLAELAGHSAGAAYPATDLGSDPRQLFRPQHHEGQDKNNENL